jgi:hypothetical protein
VMTTWNEILVLGLTEGEYTITETATGLTADFEIEGGADTAVVVFNFEEEEVEEEGFLKILKFSCVGDDDPVFTIVNDDADLGDVELPANCEDPEVDDATFTLTLGELTSAEFTLGDDGGRLIPLTVGTYVLNEVEPNVASSGDIEIVADQTTTVIVFNFAPEDVEGEEEEEEQQGGQQGGQQQRGGQLGGVPDTAMPVTGSSSPAALLALVMLTGLGAAGYAMQAEARRRR